MRNDKYLISICLLSVLIISFLFLIYKYENRNERSDNMSFNDNISSINSKIKTSSIKVNTDKKSSSDVISSRPLVNEISSIKVNYSYSNKVAVLAYHHFLKRSDKKLYQKNNQYVISTEQFEMQMKYLKNNGYNSISIDNLYCFVEGKCSVPSKAFLITIDDGNVSSYKYALPILEKYGFYSVNFVISSRIGFHGEFNPSTLQFLNQEEVDDIITNHKLMTIGSHSHALHNLINGVMPKEVLSFNELVDDLNVSKEKLHTEYFCYPFGQYNDKYIAALKASHYKLAFTFNKNGFVHRNDNLYTLKRINVKSSNSYTEKLFEKLIQKYDNN